MRPAAPQCISGRTSYLRVRLAFHPYPQLIRDFCNSHQFGPSRPVTGAAAWPWVAHTVSGLPPATNALFTLGFPRAPAVLCLNRATDGNSSGHTPKGTRSPCHPKAAYGSHCMDAVGFRLSFTPLAGVLFTVPSRYCALSVTISRIVLDRGRPSFPRGFSSPVVLELGQTMEAMNDYGTVTRCGL